MFTITLELIYHAIMGTIFSRIPDYIAYKIDFGAFCFFLFVIMLQQISFLIWTLKVTRFRSKVRRGEHDQLNKQVFESHEDFENEKMIAV
jgi:hypothetical protein